MPTSPGMEFLVIGAQKAGTTTLWNLLRDHPQPVVSRRQGGALLLPHGGLRARLGELPRAPRRPRRRRACCAARSPLITCRAGTTQAPERSPSASLGLLPEVSARSRCCATLSSARAPSMRWRSRGGSSSAASTGDERVAAPHALLRGRLAPEDTNTYLVQGEYGRILAEYLSLFPRAALHIELSDESVAGSPWASCVASSTFLGARR